MEIINQLAAPLAQSAQVARQQTSEKTQQIRRAQTARKNAAAQSDTFEHTVESTEEITPIHDEQRQPQDPRARGEGAGDRCAGHALGRRPDSAARRPLRSRSPSGSAASRPNVWQCSKRRQASISVRSRRRRSPCRSSPKSWPGVAAGSGEKFARRRVSVCHRPATRDGGWEKSEGDDCQSFPLAPLR